MVTQMYYISIHVPREGDDWGPVLTIVFAGISIHVPREGDDDRHSDFSKSFTISIHVPREGDDRLPPTRRHCLIHFNPRPP